MSNIEYFRWRPHPWHGIEIGPNPPEFVYAYIEITPYDLVKYEVDKLTGYLRVDRPQRTSSTPPTLYGFIPRTYCGKRVADLAPGIAQADGDPLDICVISERQIEHAEIILTAHVIGGLKMIDGGLADDKIVAVLEKDPVWGQIHSIHELPQALIDRLRHYFMTYKMDPGSDTQTEIQEIYDRDQAMKIVQAAIDDYYETYGPRITNPTKPGRK